MGQKMFKIIGLILILVVSFSFLAACSGQKSQEASEGEPTGEVTGKTGPAVDLTGDATAGAAIFQEQCERCHGAEGKGGRANPGSAEGTVPALNPLDEELASIEAIDVVIEHGATPPGDNPAKVMPAFGDKGLLAPQQIADVIAYILSLNKYAGDSQVYQAITSQL